jgi:cytochrome c-type biogenesis protein CcsB
MSMNEQIANLSFLLLFGSMVCYWVGPLSRDLFAYPQIASQTENQVSTDKIYENSLVLTNKQNSSTIQPVIQTPISNNFLNFSSFGSGRSRGRLRRTPINNLRKKIDVSESLFYTGRLGIILSNVSLTTLLCNRWIESGHFPLSNLYESLMFLSWSFTIIHLLLENLTNSNVGFDGALPSFGTREGEFAQSKVQNVTQGLPIGRFIGAITTPSALFTNAFATFTLPKEMQASSSLVPALQSNWLMMHVTVMIISYATLILGSLLAIAFLIIDIQIPRSLRHLQSQGPTNLSDPQLGAYNDYPRPDKSRELASPKNTRASIAFTLDNLSYRIIGIGFPFLTIGILSGAVWANEAWGSYWSWDPKETWAFLTWLIYAIYLHTRLNKGWEGKNPAIIASLGFIVVWICYLGVNLIGEGLHSYGWLRK